MTTYYIDSPPGKLKVSLEQDELVSLEILQSQHIDTCDEMDLPDAIKQLHAYFLNSAYTFTVKVNPAGTDFQRRVWQALQSIPSGTTLTYGELARQLGSSPRAVGQACRRNPIPIIIPCHRIVASQHIGGYAGAIDGQLLSIKQWLLTHENIN